MVRSIAALIAALVVASAALAADKAPPRPALASGVASLQCTISGSAIAGANNVRTMTLPDSDLQLVLNWMKNNNLAVVATQFNNGITQGFNPTNGQLEWGWFQVTVVQSTTNAVQASGVTQPPPINFQ